jgi:GST-like protein
MTDLSAFAVTRKWPARHPDRLQLYSLPTPNGVKVSIALEETGLPYEVHRVDFEKHEQTSPEFLSINPNNKIPAILDPQGPGGQPLALFESGAILLYLADKTGQLLPADPADRWHAVQWLMFQMGGVGPMFGQVGFFHKFGGKDYEDKRPRDRYVAESARLLAVLEGRLAQSPTSPPSLGCATWWASTARASWWGSTASRTCSGRSTPSSRGRRCSADWPSRRRRSDGRRAAGRSAAAALLP